MYTQISNILTQLGLSYGLFGNLFISLLSTLACVFIVLIPFILVYYIIKRCFQ